MAPTQIGRDGKMVMWRRPDLARLEARRQDALAETTAAIQALADAGRRAHVFGSVLRPATTRFGFHPHSDIDLLMEALEEEGDEFAALREA